MNKANERGIALDVLTEITKEGAYGNISLRRTLNSYGGLSDSEKAFITEIVNGSLRNLILIDYIIDSFSKTATTKMKPLILNVLRISVYQLMFMDRTPPSAVCNEAVKLTKARSFQNLAAFINGVLRSIERNKRDCPKGLDRERAPDRYMSVMYSFPLWLVRYWLTNYGADITERVCAGGGAFDICICANTLKTDPAALSEAFRASGARVSGGRLINSAVHLSHTGDISQTQVFKDGYFHVMDESAMLAVQVLDPQPGETVMDVCAAPGGKSFCSAYLMENKGRIIAWDIHAHKVKLVSETAERLGIDIIACTETDARVPVPALYGTADRVLVDAPCSGLGIVHKKPDIKYAKDMTDIKALAVLQKELLGVCSAYVKPGGVLVYCTCTVTREENDEVVRWFTEHHPFRLDENYVDNGIVQLLPEDGHDGFFVARFRRKEQA